MSSATAASDYVRRMIEKETRGWGDQRNAMSRLERRYSIPFWSLNHLRTGRAKTVEAGLFSRIRSAYLDLCERELAKLQHELAIEKARHPHDDFTDLESEAEELRSRLLAKKEAIG